MKIVSTLFISFLLTIGITVNANAATLMMQFISTPPNSSTLKETVQGCSTTSVTYSNQNVNTIANLFEDGSFELGYSADNDLSDESDNIILTGIWSTIDTKATKFRFQPNGNLAIGNGTLGWLKIYNWTFQNACVAPQSNNNHYVLTYPATFRVLKSDITLKTSNNSGTLRFTLEGYGQTSASVATPPKTAPLMKYDMQVSGSWHLGP